MKERGVSAEEVELSITQPDTTLPIAHGRTNSFKHVGGRFLRVTYKEETDRFLVITVTVRLKPFQEQSYEDRV